MNLHTFSIYRSLPWRSAQTAYSFLNYGTLEGYHLGGGRVLEGLGWCVRLVRKRSPSKAGNPPSNVAASKDCSDAISLGAQFSI